MKEIKRVTIEAVPPKKMRYKTVGDWFSADATSLIIRVADTGNWRYNMLVAIHELIEVFLCTDKGIKEKDVDRFDIRYEDDEDPGSHPKAPYHDQHMIAMGVEMLLSVLLGIKWRPYEDVLDRTWKKVPSRKKANK